LELTILELTRQVAAGLKSPPGEAAVHSLADTAPISDPASLSLEDDWALEYKLEIGMQVQLAST
jgi:hypothetical protein